LPGLAAGHRLGGLADALAGDGTDQETFHEINTEIERAAGHNMALVESKIITSG